MAPSSAPNPGGKGGGTSSTLLQTRLDNLWGGGLADRPLLRITFRVPRNSRAISRVGTNRLPRSPLRCRPTCHFHFSLATRCGPYIRVCTSTSRLLLETPLGPFLSLFPVSEGIRFVPRCTRAHSPRRCVYCHGREAPIPEDGHADCGGSTRTICPPRAPV